MYYKLCCFSIVKNYLNFTTPRSENLNKISSILIAGFVVSVGEYNGVS